ncbi:MAG TPA: alpha/beta hydrolase [Terriglobales bacterium]|jgi:pimeloyl-ACP methyl ester carboxylesterase
MRQVRSGDAEIVYEVLGSGPPVILLHPFPANHALWLPAVQSLTSSYQLILPDLRGHGDSEIGEGPALMEKHAADIARIMDDADVKRAILIGNSIGGYAIFECWRRWKERITGLVLCNTKAIPDTPEIRSTRLQSVSDVLERGTEPFFASQVTRLVGKTTQASRPDLVDGALRMMRKMSTVDVAMVQRGMAERTDSMPILKTIHVPTLVITGIEDELTGIPDADAMHKNIPRSELKVVAKAGHYSPWEQPEEVGRLLRQFLDAHVQTSS